eukprot:GHVU01029372.1.p1 GENE.GHVU01029372.1~~GHVU01029372.1.p1  ORF type:complete len:241 (+),score=24.63 GHVU01029372.1:335-1057(+)
MSDPVKGGGGENEDAELINGEVEEQPDRCCCGHGTRFGVEIGALALVILMDIGFIAGSAMWVVGLSKEGGGVFGGACLIGAIGLSMLAYYLANPDKEWVMMGAIIGYIVGCVMFAIGCFIYFDDNFYWEAVLLWLLGSVFFTAGAILMHVKHLTESHDALKAFLHPSLIFATIGSFLFVAGTVVLYFKDSEHASAYLYLVGSILFFIQSILDTCIYCKACPAASLKWLTFEPLIKEHIDV